MNKFKRKMDSEEEGKTGRNEDGDLEAGQSTEETENSPGIEAKPSSSIIQLRISDRLLRKKEEEERKETENDEANGDEKSPVVAESSGLDKPRRTWEWWSPEDKKVFFEALNESGKNFELIQNYFQSKFKKNKAGQVYKNKEQIRTFYYRTWHKISKHVTFPEKLQKSFKELYGLINYGELRKKIGSTIGDKYGAKLQELIFNGHTHVRVKGKTFRVKTPVCRALMRLNGRLVDTGQNSKATIPSLPERVTIVLKPMRESDLSYVHGRSFQNPCVNLQVKLSTRVEIILQHLEKKWTCLEERLKNSVKNNSYSPSVISSSPSELWIMQSSGTAQFKPVINPIAPITSATLSLSNLQSKKPNGISSASDNDTEKEESDNNRNDISTQHQEKSTPKKDSPVEPKTPDHDQKLEWCKSNVGSLTVGELYLKLGNASSGTIEMRYAWRTPNPDIPDILLKQRPVLSLKHLANHELTKRQTKITAPSLNSGNNNSKASTCTIPYPRVNGAMNSRKEASSSTNSQTSSHKNGETVEFLKPAAPPVLLGPQSDQSLAFKQQVKRLLPKFNNRRGRPMSRKNVITRQLIANRPIQPMNNIQGKNGVKLRLMQSNILPVMALDKQTSVQQGPINLPANLNLINKSVAIVVPQNMNSDPSIVKGLNQHSVSNIQQTVRLPDVTISDSSADNLLNQNALGRSISPTGSLSSFFPDSSLPDLAVSATKGDHFLDSVLENSNSCVLQTPPRHRPTPPSSPSRAVNDWDLSLSSFLNLGESPAKNISQSELNINEESSHSTNSEVDRNILSLMSENSIDFSMKFAKLASHVNDGDELK